jgi:hypothetical protein
VSDAPEALIEAMLRPHRERSCRSLSGNRIVHALAFVVIAGLAGEGACAPKPCESPRSRAATVTPAPDAPPNLGYGELDTEVDWIARWATPRCLTTDARCGPDVPSAFGACYRPGADRIPVTESEDWYILPNRNDAPCTFDGECRLAECDELCTRYDHQPRPMVECRRVLRQALGDTAPHARPDVLCGCVRNQCRFFTQ